MAMENVHSRREGQSRRSLYPSTSTLEVTLKRTSLAARASTCPGVIFLRITATLYFQLFGQAFLAA